MPVTVITEGEQLLKLIKGDKAVLVDFWAPWCGPCRAISPFFEKLSDGAPNVEFCSVNIDDLPAVAGDFDIRSIPAFKYFKGGEKAGEVIGQDIKGLEALVVKAAE